MALTVHVVVDRDDRKRAEFWSQALENVRKNRNLELDWRIQPLPDLLAEPLTDEPVFLEQLKDGHVLIVNWDAINDDLDFGADRSLRWFHQRRTILHRWVAEGGILVLEGQATWGVPMQECYDAVLGVDELLVCGPEDPRKPYLQLRRSVGDCRMTSIARTAAGFENLDDIAPRERRTQDDMFPPTTAGRLVGWSLKEDGWDWGRSLYRGWFRRDLWPRRTAHTWVPYVTRKERWPNAHATLKVARLGEGAVFASTMLLASTGQEQLITAILRTHGRADRLPEPGVLRRELSRRLVAGVTAVLTGLLAFFLTSERSGPVRVVITAAVGTAVAVALYLLPHLYRALVRLLRGITGN